MHCIQADPPDNLDHCNHLDHPNQLSSVWNTRWQKVVPTRQDICKNVITGTATLKRIFCNPGWQKLCEGTKGLRRKVWTRTKIFSPNIRYVVAILRFVKI